MKYPWMKCSHCQGYGIVHGMSGEPADCRHCGGSGLERARDAKGRFVVHDFPDDELLADFDKAKTAAVEEAEDNWIADEILAGDLWD